MHLSISLGSWDSSDGEDTWCGQALKLHELFFLKSMILSQSILNICVSIKEHKGICMHRQWPTVHNYIRMHIQWLVLYEVLGFPPQFNQLGNLIFSLTFRFSLLCLQK